MTNKLREALRLARATLVLYYDVHSQMGSKLGNEGAAMRSQLARNHETTLAIIDAALNESDDAAGGTYGLR